MSGWAKKTRPRPTLVYTRVCASFHNFLVFTANLTGLKKSNLHYACHYTPKRGTSLRDSSQRLCAWATQKKTSQRWNTVSYLIGQGNPKPSVLIAMSLPLHQLVGHLTGLQGKGMGQRVLSTHCVEQSQLAAHYKYQS